MHKGLSEYAGEYSTRWFLNPSSFDKQGGIWIMRAGKKIAKPHFRIPPRMLAYYSLHFVFEGQGTFRFDSESYRLEKGDIFAVFPHHIHSVETSPDAPIQTFWISFGGMQSESLLQQIGLTPFQPFQATRMNESVVKRVEEFEEIVSTRERHSHLSALGIFFLLMAELRKETEDHPHQVVGEVGWLRKAVEFMNTHYLNISVQDVADFLGISRSHFSNTFSQSLSMSPKKYLDSIKMKKAASMLEHADLSISDIALFLTKDIFAFSRAFKNHFGMSPSEYRKNLVSGISQATTQTPLKFGALIINDTFDDQPAGGTPRDYAIFGSEITVEKAPDLIGHALFFSKQDTGSLFAERTFSPVTGRLRLTFRVMVQQTTSPMAIHFINVLNAPVMRISLNHSGTLSYTEASIWTQSRIEYQTDIWHHVEIELDLDTERYSVHFNHVLAVHHARIESSSHPVSKLRIGMQGTGSAYFDDLSLMWMMNEWG
ncbi:helix-turn-helix transcriptional regulator [Marinicrinis sediminis]|uniref:AraC family transcriptional regulator n=1 Tax=Marinicrinis sediminis TaxID=1652465 RepID=A0ABW5R778_9BACL